MDKDLLLQKDIKDLRTMAKDAGYVWLKDYHTGSTKEEIIILLEKKEEINKSGEVINQVNEIVKDIKPENSEQVDQIAALTNIVSVIAKKLKIDIENPEQEEDYFKKKVFTYRLRQLNDSIAIGFDKKYGNNGVDEYVKDSSGQMSIRCRVKFYNTKTEQIEYKVVDQVDFFTKLSKVISFDDVKVEMIEKPIKQGMVTKINYQPVASQLNTVGTPYGAIDTGMEVPNVVIIPITTFLFNINGKYIEVDQEIVNQ